MSIIDQNDFILLCKNQLWVCARVIVDTESIRSLAFDIHFLRLFDNKPEICLFQKILNASNQKTITIRGLRLLNSPESTYNWILDYVMTF